LCRSSNPDDVDPEYNRLGLDPNAVELPNECREGDKKLILPDIVVHRRGNDNNNLRLIEVKTHLETGRYFLKYTEFCCDDKLLLNGGTFVGCVVPISFLTTFCGSGF
jgi:hypothetical protein